jgi:eukaryotic-like serine/threonine-protein kinase
MSEDIIGRELLGQFRVVERIGRGGMGEVFKAEQPAMDRLVAIKILHSKLAHRSDLISRFRREARAMSRLSHPNTVRVFLYGHLEETGQLYIVMEYLEGVDLAKLVRRSGPLDAQRGIRVMIQILGALEEAHSVGVIHRDLKPENILLTEQGGMPDFPKVLDFGLAKVRETKPRPGSMILTQEGMVFGTPEFMSPEQARGETLDPRSDVYSVALIFYELVTGNLPFPRCKPMEYIAHHINTPPMPITERNKNVELPPALDPILARALEKNRDDRFQSARDFAEALKAVLPQDARSVSLRAMPNIPAGRNELDERTTNVSADKDQEIVQTGLGKGLLIGLIAVIALLLIAVVWLIAARTSNDAVVVPVPPPGATVIEDTPATQPTGSNP